MIFCGADIPVCQAGNNACPTATARGSVLATLRACYDVGAMPTFFDTHAHLDQEEFDTDRGDVLARARAAGVESILAVAVSAESSAAVLELAAHQPGIHATVGIHPNYVAQAKPGDWDRVVALAGSPGV